MSSTIVTGSYKQSGTTRCLPKQGIITAQLSQITRKVNQNNGKENVFKHIFQGYILPKDKQSKISMTGYKVDNHLGKGGGSHDITHTTVLG